jgi:tripartite-type tricarboxylate transporter receptor subunit TctC
MKNRLLRCLLLVFALQCAGALADEFPSRPLKILVGSPPGGGTDIMARTVGEKLADVLKQPVVIENRPGASNTIAADVMLASPADGYTLLLGNVTSHAIAPHLLRLRFDPIKDFAPIALVAVVPNVLIVNDAVPAKTPRELVAAMKAKPGAYRFASSGAGSTQHLAGEALKLASNVDIVHIPYKGSSQAITDLMGGHVEVNFDTLPSAITQIKAGRVKALAVTTTHRSAQLPDVPTLAEAGIPGIDVSTWYALYAPAKTPKLVVDRLQKELAAILGMPDVRKRIEEVGGETGALSAEQFAAFARAELARYGKLIHDAGIKIE